MCLTSCAICWNRLEQLATKKGLEMDWAADAGPALHAVDDLSTSSGDQATETAVTVSRWRVDGGSAQSATSGELRTQPDSAVAQQRAERMHQLKQVCCQPFYMANLHSCDHQFCGS